MISNIADRTDARILSNDEIDAVAGGVWGLPGLVGTAVAGYNVGIAAALVSNAGEDSIGTLGTRDLRGDVSGGGAAHESGPTNKE
jgi:hypothetical protein